MTKRNVDDRDRDRPFLADAPGASVTYIFDPRVDRHLSPSRQCSLHFDSFHPRYCISKMHHCLLVTEIVHYIFDWLSIRSSRANSPTLLSLATTCRTFQHPALDVLWRDLDPSFAPLIKTLPRDLWEQRRNSGNKLVRKQSINCKYIRGLKLIGTRLLVFKESFSRG